MHSLQHHLVSWENIAIIWENTSPAIILSRNGDEEKKSSKADAGEEDSDFDDDDDLWGKIKEIIKRALR